MFFQMVFSDGEAGGIDPFHLMDSAKGALQMREVDFSFMVVMGKMPDLLSIFGRLNNGEGGIRKIPYITKAPLLRRCR